MDQSQDRTVVLAVVLLIGAIALIGLSGTIWLVHDGTEASAVAVVATITGAAAGSLGTLLARTSSAPPAPVAASEATGYMRAVADVQTLAGSPPGDAQP